MSFKLLVPTILAVSLAAGTAHAQADPEKGKDQFKKCIICHAITAGQNKIGPSLFGVVGRESGTEPGFSYSDAMQGFKHVWDKEALDKYLTDPRQVVPGTKMIFPGLKDEADREALIAYLETLK